MVDWLTLPSLVTLHSERGERKGRRRKKRVNKSMMTTRSDLVGLFFYSSDINFSARDAIYITSNDASGWLTCTFFRTKIHPPRPLNGQCASICMHEWKRKMKIDWCEVAKQLKSCAFIFTYKFSLALAALHCSSPHFCCLICNLALNFT